MTDIMKIALSAVLSYFIGCFNTAYFISKNFKKTDIREHGSGNAGTTNMLRTYGLKAAVPVFLFDALKGFLAVIIAGFISSGLPAAVFLSSAAVVLGHNWPVTIRFKGGKGIATTLGVGLALSPLPTLAALAAFTLAAVLFRIVSLGALVGLVSVVVTFLLFGEPWYKTGAMGVLLVLGFIQHRENIKRLIKGTESKVGKKQ